MTPNVISIEYIDHSDEYGPFGKRVARSDVRDMTEAQIAVEKAEMLAQFGPTVNAVEVEEVPAVRPNQREVVTPNHVITSDSPIWLGTTGSNYSIILNDIEYRSDSPMHVTPRN